jgi:hypothetical protein
VLCLVSFLVLLMPTKAQAGDCHYTEEAINFTPHMPNRLLPLQSVKGTVHLACTLATNSSMITQCWCHHLHSSRKRQTDATGQGEATFRRCTFRMHLLCHWYCCAPVVGRCDPVFTRCFAHGTCLPKE